MVGKASYKARKSQSTSDHPRMTVRFLSRVDHQLVHQVADDEGLSVNAWSLRVLMNAAKDARRKAARVAAEEN